MKRVKILFLDIDGVLNCSMTPYCHLGVRDIDMDKLMQVKSIVENTKAKILLISSWKEGWHSKESKKPFQSATADYLDMRFSSAGLRISNKVNDIDYGGRGKSILDYLASLKKKGIEVISFAILDDDMGDYGKAGLAKHLVKTSFSRGGLTEGKAREAIAILNEEKQDE